MSKNLQDPSEIHSAEYNKNYIRNSIIALLRYNKPVIVTGYLQSNPDVYFYSFTDIKPYYPKYENQLRIICSHINISKRQVDAVINVSTRDCIKKPFVLICKPYLYKSQADSENRGGLTLTAELGAPGILDYDAAEVIIQKIDPNKYINFLEFGGGYYLGIDPVQVKQQKSKMKHQRRMLNYNNPIVIANNFNSNSTNNFNFNTNKIIPLFPISNKQSQPNKYFNINHLIKNSKPNNTLDGWFLKF